MSDATFVYDDDCGFCTWYAQQIAQRSDLRLVGFSELTDDQRDRLPDNYEESSHLLVDDECYSGGASIEQAVVNSELGEEFRPLVDFLRQFDEYGDFRDQVYDTVSSYRSDLGALFYAEPPARDDADET